MANSIAMGEKLDQHRIDEIIKILFGGTIMETKSVKIRFLKNGEFDILTKENPPIRETENDLIIEIVGIPVDASRGLVLQRIEWLKVKSDKFVYTWEETKNGGM